MTYTFPAPCYGCVPQRRALMRVYCFVEEVLRAVVQDLPCQVVFISEMDAHRDQRRVVADGWVVHRHYGGECTRAFGWALRASTQRHVINMQWGHRCSGLELALPGEGRPRQSVLVVGLHAPTRRAASTSARRRSCRSFEKGIGRGPCWWLGIGISIRAQSR